MTLRRPSRLRDFQYVGPQAYFLTISTHWRQRAFEDEQFGRLAVGKLWRSASTHGFALAAYCLMPDHVHLVAEGEREDSRLESFTRSTHYTIRQILEAADDWGPQY